MKYRQYYVNLGFKITIPRAFVEPSFMAEYTTDKTDNPHMMLIHENYNMLEHMKSEMPYVDLISGENVNPLEAKEPA